VIRLPAISRRQCRPGRGQGLVEFALVLPVFILVLVALFDLGRGVFAFNTITNAAREGARLAIVNQDIPLIVARAKSQTQIAELDDPSVAVAFYQVGEDGAPDLDHECDLVAVGCIAVVSFQATYEPITPIIANLVFKDGVTFEARSVLGVEYRCPNADFPAAGDCPKQP
jgi:Flp pilus assembly protein TadG